jgi:hypothetical protein
MRFPRWTMQRAIMRLTAVAVLTGIGCWVWMKPALRLEVELGPGARFSASISPNPGPRMGPTSLPSLPYITDDVQYFPPGPDFPWANTQATITHIREIAQQKGREDR